MDAFLHSLTTVFNALPYIAQGAFVTIVMVAGALSLGFLLGLPLAVAQVYAPRPVRMLVGLYVWFFRGVPVLLLLFLFYFGLFNVIGLDLGMIGSSCAVLGLASAAYQSQIFRGSIQSLPSGQFKAGRALGMTDMQCIRFRRSAPGPAHFHPRMVQRVLHPAQGLRHVLRPRHAGNHGPYAFCGLPHL